MKNKSIYLILVLFFLTANIFAQNTKKAIITSFTIEGINNTELNYLGNTAEYNAFEERIYEKTIVGLRNKYGINEIQSNQNPKIKRNPNLNRFKGVKKLKKKERIHGSDTDLIIKIKCDIAFDETALGFLLNLNTSRAHLYLSIGVFNNKGELIEVLKAKSKESPILIGDDLEEMEYMSLEEFEIMYDDALQRIF